MVRRRMGLLACAVVTMLGLVGAGALPAQADAGHARRDFVVREGTQLRLDDKPFRFAGTNNYYLFYQSHAMVDDVFARAATAGFTVLRTWGWSDIGALDGTLTVGNKPNGVYFQYWNGTAPAYNDGDDGLARLDYVVWKAGQSGVRLVIPFTNNWSDFGGIDQYVRWAGLAHHDDFYSDATIRGWYQAYVKHLLTHVNPLTGLAYKDDPTIMAWELANEPRCGGSGLYPASANCTTDLLTNWVDTMSRYVKSVDHRHLVGTGDEGFTCTDPGGSDWTTNCGSGVDSPRFAAQPAIDYLSFHLYPDSWGKKSDPAWSVNWITSHVQAAKAAHKAVLLGEYGWLDKATRNPVYQSWTNAFIKAGGNGLLYWILSGLQDDGSRYPDYDGYTVYCPGPVCQTISNAGQTMTTDRTSFPPVADDDTATTPFDTAVTLAATANDIAYQASIVPGSLDLDPATAGRQSSVTVAGGQFTAAADGTVAFTPAEGFHGKANATYTVRDNRGRLSNTATLTVTVQANPSAPIVFSSFEDASLDGFAPASWQTDAGTVAQQTDFATDGSAGVRVVATGGGWFGITLGTPVDISGKSTLKVDVRTGADAGTSVSIAVQNGSAWDWCQGNFTWVPQSTTTTYVADLSSGFSCDGSTLTEVHTVWVYLSPGTFDLDSLRAG